MPIEGLIVLDAVDAVNRRGVVLRVLKMLILVDAFDERRQIEIILAEQDAHRLDGAHSGLAAMRATVGDLHQVVIFYRRTDLPQAFNKFPTMLRLNVMEAFVADEVFHLIQTVQRRAGQNQLVQNRKHFLLDHGAAFQQNFADGQNLTARQKARQGIIQQIAAFGGVIQNLPARLAVSKVVAQRVEVSLDSLFTDSKAISGLLFVQHTALYQHLLDIEYTVQSTITHSSFSFSAHCNTVQQQSQFFV